MNIDYENKLKSILLVEDEETQLNTLKVILGYFCENVYTASNGIDGLALFNKHKPKLIISDIKMPKMDGLEFCKKVKQVNPDQYFLFLTAYNDNRLLMEAIKLHVTGYILKPLTVHDLKKEIDAVMELENQKKIKKEYKNLQNIINGIIDPIEVIDKNRKTVLMNKAAEINYENNKNRDLSEICENNRIEEDITKIKSPITSLKRYLDQNQNEIYRQVTFSPLKDENNEVYAYLKHSSDVTELIYTQRELNFNTNYDLTTSLPNRNLFLKKTEEVITTSFHHNLMCSLVLIDITDLKSINDSFGYDIGNEIILEFSKFIKDTVRKEDIIARISGDTFAVLLNNIEDKFAPLRLINELKRKTSEYSFEVMFNDLRISFNCGISIYPQDATTALSLLKNADSALNHIKTSSLNNFAFYTEELTQKALDKVIFESNLKKSIHNKEFDLYFQPQYNLKNNSLTGMEVLIRWLNSPLGIISPDKFIPYLESSGLILDVGYWIIQNVFQIVASWQKKNYTFGKVSLNVSLQQLNDGTDFIEKIKYYLQTTKCDPSSIGLEITESNIMENFNETLKVLKELSKMGFYILIDDFGTGYSSLSHLKNMPINKLKIDKSFIDGVPNDKDDVILTKTIIDLAKNLNLDIIAEGVESIEQIKFLEKHGCYDIQGYYFSKPLTKEEIEKLII